MARRYSRRRERIDDLLLTGALFLIGVLVLAGLVSAFLRETAYEHEHPRPVPPAVLDAFKETL